MENGEVLVVVLGYGCHLTNPTKAYLDNVVHFVGCRNVTAIIATGGFTNRKSAPCVSEAWMMDHYLKSKEVKIPILMDESARTTNENLKNVRRIMLDHRLSEKWIVIFCDRARRIKVGILSYVVLGFVPEIRTYEITRGFFAKTKQLLVATPLDVLASRIPFFERMELRRRERIMNNS